MHLLLAAMAGKLTGRPVKLILTREQTYSLMPFRGASRHRIRMGADVNGKLEAILQESVMAQGAGGTFIEPAGENTTKVYACKNILVHSKSARIDTNAPGWMRAPGSGFGQFAVEVTIDMLAEKVGLDPLEMRLRNYADVDPTTVHEWSSKSLRHCYKAGAQRIGWHEREPQVGSMREGHSLIAYGMATSIYPIRQMPAVARVILHPDGHAEVHSALHEMGQGGITTMLPRSKDHRSARRSGVARTCEPDRSLDPVFRSANASVKSPRMRDEMRKLYYDLAGALLPALLSIADPDHILYGSDWPFTQLQSCLKLTADLDNNPNLDRTLHRNLCLRTLCNCSHD